MTSDRPLAPFGRRTLKVVSTRRLGGYFGVTVLDTEAPIVRAGQFHMIAAASGWGDAGAGRPWLARAISFLASDGRGRIEFLIDEVGPGTEGLAKLQVGDSLTAVGPLGNGFPSPTEGRRPVLAGGGIGIAPVLALSDELTSLGSRHELILGFRDGILAAAAGGHPAATITTDDGSVGQQGSLVGPVVAAIEEVDSEVFACGPPGMLDAIRRICDEAGVPCWLALEAPMACGFGACFGCAVETRDGIIRLCIDGPVLAAETLAGISATGRVDP